MTHDETAALAAPQDPDNTNDVDTAVGDLVGGFEDDPGDEWEEEDDDWEYRWDDGWDHHRDAWDDEQEWQGPWETVGEDDHAGELRPGPRVETDDELLAWVCALVGPDRKGPFSVQVMFLDGDRMALPVRVPLDEVPSRPVGQEVDAVLASMGHVLDSVAPDGTLVIALVRRGGGDRGDLEIAWTRALLESARRVPVPLRAVVAVGRHRARLLSPALTA